ncbi:MAG: protein-(glutamine-N5) methyltransferase, release factor-specific [Ignavibacteria bacterium RBG_13_36_8]|nr:MAG: protein-(glutamine-N5) methyltransferase, release factor-specific [Ignavibacteria bacterium RBG_13_36_8]
MLKVLEAIQLSTEYLEKKGIESSRINAELLLADVLKCNRLNLYLSFDRPLTEEEKNLYRELISRRGKFEPLQYILGKVEFYGLEFKVNPSVLIPRPETEILVETIVNYYKGEEKLNILDIGTGSGNIAIVLAKHLQNSNVIAIDISQEALEVAAKNAEHNGVKNNLEFCLKDIFNDEDCQDLKGFDIIVSNPPYVSIEKMKVLQKEITDYEPEDALTDKSDGFLFYKRISTIAKDILKRKGKVYFEMSIDQSAEVSEIMRSSGLKNITIIKDLQNVDRVIYGEMT